MKNIINNFMLIDFPFPEQPLAALYIYIYFFFAAIYKQGRFLLIYDADKFRKGTVVTKIFKQ